MIESIMPYIIGAVIQSVVIMVIQTLISLGIFARPKDISDAKDQLREEFEGKFQTINVCSAKHDQIAKLEQKIDKTEQKVDALSERMGNIEKQTSSMATTMEMVHETMNRIIKLLTKDEG